MKLLLLVMVLVLGGCGLFQTTPTLSASGDNAQIQQAESGSSAQAESIENVTTVNEDGLDPWMWLLIGMLLPMPKFMRMIF